MYKVKVRKTTRIRRKIRIKALIRGTASLPRLTVFKSNKYIYAQLIDDTKGHTLASVYAAPSKKLKDEKKVDASFRIGKEIAEKAGDLKIKSAVFDRNGYRYHGRVKAVAEGAREGGLKI